jgi:hypothetical protein
VATTNNWFLISDEGSPTWASTQVEEISPSADSVATYNIYDFQAVYSDSVSIVYDVTSTDSLIQGGGTFPFSDATADLENRYNVIQEVASADLVIAYAMRQQVERLHEVSYDVLVEAAADTPAFTFDLSGPVETDAVEISYRVLIGAETDSPEFDYSVIEQVEKDTVATYSITSTPLTATSLVDVTYNVVQGIEADTIATYWVFNEATKDLVDSYNVLVGVEQDQILIYSVDGQVEADVEISYNLVLDGSAESDVLVVYQIDSEMVRAPNVIGLPLEEGILVLQNSGIQIGTITYAA